ncbi:MAG: NAD-dependent epimerase/dehydratase family protein [Acidimicrobiales bacterium]
MNVGLTGATGHLGSLLLDRLVADSDVVSVRSVARRALPESAAGSSRKVHHVQADLRSPDARRGLAGVDLLYHLGFQLWAPRRSASAASDMEAANVAGTANVLAAGPAAVVLASSAAVYGAWPDNPVPLGEEAPARPNKQCAYASHKLTAEGLCADAAPSVALRIGAVLGPHADPVVARAARGYRRVVPAVRGVTQALQFVHEDDAAAALVAAGAALLGSRVTGVVNVATADWLSARDISKIAGGRVVALPRSLLIALAEAGRWARAVPFGADRAALLAGPMALSVRRAADLLGWRAQRSSAEVLAGAVGAAGHGPAW